MKPRVAGALMFVCVSCVACLFFTFLIAPAINESLKTDLLTPGQHTTVVGYNDKMNNTHVTYLNLVLTPIEEVALTKPLETGQAYVYVAQIKNDKETLNSSSIIEVGSNPKADIQQSGFKIIAIKYYLAYYEGPVTSSAPLITDEIRQYLKYWCASAGIRTGIQCR